MKFALGMLVYMADGLGHLLRPSKVRRIRSSLLHEKTPM
jgi:hypothetical protein